MRITSANEARATIAMHVLGSALAAEALGDVRLHAHQRDGVERCRKLLHDHGGALLADDVGLGKSFVALALARDAQQPCVIAPAALRDAWTVAARRASVSLRFISVESLGRRATAHVPADLVIIDEAHHLRARTTRRFAAASAMCASARVLLLSATPVHNRLDDLRNILSLFLGERARAMSEEELAGHVVRRRTSEVGAVLPSLPSVRMRDWVASTDVDCLDRLLELPPCVPPVDGDDGGALLTYTLARQWASSRAALRSALHRRLARAHALEDALLAGHHPSRQELRAWCFADGAQQLAFPELVVTGESRDRTLLLAQVRRHAGAVRELVAWLDATPDPDIARANALRAILRDHAGERVVAFSEYSDTIVRMYGLLVSHERVAMLTHAGGRVAGGRMTRRDILERFAPGAASRTRDGERLDLLLTTDVLSEGVNLQDASVVVHLDLSWNPARLQQRVGRVRRIGAARTVVSVYAFAPPAPAERLLRLEQRLRLKLSVAARAVGLAGAILPGLAPSGHDAPAACRERIAAALGRWRNATPPARDLVAAAARSTRAGALACVVSGGEVMLVSVEGAQVSDRPDCVEAFTACDSGADAALDVVEAQRIRRLVEGWLRRRAVAGVMDLPAVRVASARRALLQRVDTIARRVPRHRQPELAPLVRAARTAAAATLSAGAERVLDQLTHAPLPDAAWLHAVGEFAAIHARARDAGPGQLLALLVFRTSE